jgi:hypothetical protein
MTKGLCMNVEHVTMFPNFDGTIGFHSGGNGSQWILHTRCVQDRFPTPSSTFTIDIWNE